MIWRENELNPPDAPILSQGTNQARRGSRKRPDPPGQQSHTPLTRILFPGRLCSRRVTGLPLPKAHSAPPDQRRRHVAHGPRCPRLHASKDRERSARWQRAAQLLLAKADVGAVSRQLELALLYDGKLDVRAMAGKPERTSPSASILGHRASPKTAQILLAHHGIVPNIAWLPIGCRQA